MYCFRFFEMFASILWSISLEAFSDSRLKHHSCPIAAPSASILQSTAENHVPLVSCEFKAHFTMGKGHSDVPAMSPFRVSAPIPKHVHDRHSLWRSLTTSTIISVDMDMWIS